MDALEFAEPWVSNDSSQYGCEVAEATEGMVDSSGEVLVPAQVGDKIERQHRCEQTNQFK